MSTITRRTAIATALGGMLGLAGLGEALAGRTSSRARCTGACRRRRNRERARRRAARTTCGLTYQTNDQVPVTRPGRDCYPQAEVQTFAFPCGDHTCVQVAMPTCEGGTMIGAVGGGSTDVIDWNVQGGYICVTRYEA